MARKNSFNPADLALHQLAGMDMEGYMMPDTGEAQEEGPVLEPEQSGREAGRDFQPAQKKPAERKAPSGRDVQMNIRRTEYEKLRLAKMAYQMTTGKAISSGDLVSMLIEKGLRSVDRKVDAVYRQIIEAIGKEG